MKYSTLVANPATLTVDAIVYLTPQSEKLTDPALKSVDKLTNGAINGLFRSGEFGGKDGEIAVVVHPHGFRAGRLLLVGLGEKKKLSADAIRKALGHASRHKTLSSSVKAAVILDGYDNPAYYQAAVEGHALGRYKLLDYKSGEAAKDTSKLSELTFVVSRRAALTRLTRAVERGKIIAEGQLMVRRLSATPPNDLTPTMYAEKIQKWAKEYKLSCQVLDEKGIAKEKMGGLLGVSKGSVEPPRFVMLRYQKGPARQKPIVLVGKGVTFDAGGISLKPAENMHEMKQDMTGSAVVLATIITAARLKLPLNIVALMPITENLPSGTATRPGDILHMRNGKTVEVINTDAEGRLILADALDYARGLDPQAVIDVATLTGAALFILGYAGAPILGNNDKLVKRAESASKTTAERVWHMPIWDDHREQMKSSIADLVNSGGRPAGTIAASAFLENFIGDWPWLHIDIAWMDMEYAGKPYTPKGASGFGVRLLTQMLTDWKNL
ncbi:MAG: leucyl aminopeptidase [candidate division Zixibacteria bacterium]|nr:leucyl aminopeptidase [candidate division Zixibacteria bacterium]